MRYHGVETFYKVEKGNIVSKRVTKNAYIKPSVPFNQCIEQIRGNFNSAKFLELNDAIIVAYFTYKINPDGTFNMLDEAKIDIKKNNTTSTITDKEHPYMKELTVALKTIPQWEGLIIDGEPIISAWLKRQGRRI